MSLSTNAGSRSANDYTANELRAQTVLDAPTYADVADAPQEGGLVVYIDGSGADGDTPGHYCHDGSGYVRVGSAPSGSVGIDIENTDGTVLLSNANPIQAGANVSWTDDGDESATLDATDTNTDTFPGLTDVDTGTLTNRPSPGTAGLWYFTTDNNGVSVDDGTDWQLIAEHPSNIAAADLGFDPATETELNTHAGTPDAHHAKTTSTDLESGGSDELSVTNLSGDLADAQDPKSHSHPLSDLDASGASSGQVVKYDGSNWVPGTDETGSGSDTSRTATTVTSDYTASAYDIVLVDTSGGSVTVTLPAPTDGEVVDIKTIDATNTTTIATPGSETIDGQSTRPLNKQYESLTITTNGTNFYII